MLELDPAGVRSILIVRMSALGDVVHVLPALEALRATFPRARVSWLVEPLGQAILEGHPHLDNVFVVPRQRWKRELRSPRRWAAVAGEAFRLARTLRRERFDLVLDFQGNLRGAVSILAAGGRESLGFHRRNLTERGAGLFTKHRARFVPGRTSKVEKNLALVRELGYDGPCPRGVLRTRLEDRGWAASLLRTLPGSGPAIVIHPAVSRFGEFKRWPVERYRALIDLLRERHDARILVTWGPGERSIADAVGRPTVLAEDTDLLRFAALLEAADLVIAADTGALPIASVLGTPAVGIFGPKDPVVYAPRPSCGEVVTSTAPCSPCSLRTCEHKICMTLIAPETVLEAAGRALAAGRCLVPT